MKSEVKQEYVLCLHFFSLLNRSIDGKLALPTIYWNSSTRTLKSYYQSNMIIQNEVLPYVPNVLQAILYSYGGDFFSAKKMSPGYKVHKKNC